MGSSKRFLSILWLALGILLVTITSSGVQSKSTGESRYLNDANTARNEAQSHFRKANEAQVKLFEKEDQSDAVGYEKWLNKMRSEDEKFLTAAARYQLLRDKVMGPTEEQTD